MQKIRWKVIEEGTQYQRPVSVSVHLGSLTSTHRHTPSIHAYKERYQKGLGVWLHRRTLVQHARSRELNLQYSKGGVGGLTCGHDVHPSLTFHAVGTAYMTSPSSSFPDSLATTHHFNRFLVDGLVTETIQHHSSFCLSLCTIA